MGTEQDSRRKVKESAAATKRGTVKREELVGERNRREGKNKRGITTQRQQKTETPHISFVHRIFSWEAFTLLRISGSSSLASA